MIKFVTFDLWETLIADSPQLDNMRTAYRVENILALLSKKHPGIDIERISAAHENTWRVCSASWGMDRDISFADQIRLFIGLIDENILPSLNQSDFSTISEIYAKAALQFPPSLIEGAREVLAHLSDSRHTMGLICNTGRTPGFMLRELLQGYDVMRFFDSALFSDETIIRKPNVAIFEKSIQELRAEKPHTVHVGDSWENDILGAQAAGIKAIWIHPEKPAQPDCPIAKSIAELPAVLDTL